MAKQAGARFPDGLGRASRARAPGIPQATATFSCTVGRARGDPAARKGDSGSETGTILFSGVEDSLSPRRIVAPTFARRNCPQFCATPMRSAAHRFRLLGYENLDFTPRLPSAVKSTGISIPCMASALPLDPWCKIPFLDFAAVGDHKVIWELNRHQHLVTLAKAQLLSWQ
jgi:hypothetical protein